MPWAIYGKRLEDKNFKALDYQGVRVSKLAKAGVYAEKADAEEVLAKHKGKPGVQFQIRKVK